MSDTAEIRMESTKLKEWETLKLHTHQSYPEIGILRLSRPEKLNAINDTMIDNLHSCLDFLSHAFDCRVVILCGEGRVFCAGIPICICFTHMGQGRHSGRQGADGQYRQCPGTPPL